MIETVKSKFSLPYGSLANQVGLSYRTLMRWKQRLANGKNAVEKRGPKKVRPLNLGELKKKIRDLDHGPKRSHGTGELHGAYAGSISRRELNELVRKARNESNDRKGVIPFRCNFDFRKLRHSSLFENKSELLTEMPVSWGS